MSFLKLFYDLVWVSSDVTTANLVSTCLPNGERAPKLSGALPRRRGSRSSAIFIYDVNKPLNGRITSAVAVRALLGHDGSAAAAQRQSDRAAAVPYKSRTRAQIYDAAASLSSYAAARLHTFLRHIAFSLAMLYSCREWFIAGIFIFCLLSTHTYTHTVTGTGSMGTAHSLREGKREREQLFLCQTYACVVVDGRQKGKQLNWTTALV